MEFRRLVVSGNAGVLGWLLICLVISVSYSLYYMPFVIDDALITYRYCERLLHGGGLTWNDGEYVEGYSNFFWLMLVSLGGLISTNLLMVGWTLGLLSNAAVLVSVVWTFRRSPDGSTLPMAAGLLTLTLSGAFALWGVGGLETPLVEALLAWALAILYRMPLQWRYVARSALLLGLLAITRPDGILFGASIAAAVIIRDGRHPAVLRRAVILVLIPACFLLIQTAFRLEYYGDFLPNTAYARLAFTMNRLWIGGAYVLRGALLNIVPIAAMMGASAILLKSRQWHALRSASISFIPGIVWLIYTVAIGGDRLPFFRHWMPSLICFAFTVSNLLSAITVIVGRRVAIGLAVAVVLHFALLINVEWPPVPGIPQLPEGVPRAAIVDGFVDFYRNLIWSQLRAGEFLRKAFGPKRPLLAINSAGAIPYSSELPSLDMLGLADSYIAHHRPADMGKGDFVGHELGSGTYVLSRKPDLIAFCEPTLRFSQPCFRAEHEMAASLEFRSYYRLIYFRTADVNVQLWTRVEGGRVGIQRSMEEIYIPGFLLANSPEVSAVLDASGTAVAELTRGAAVIERIHFPSGIWKVFLTADVGLELESLPSTGVSVLTRTSLLIVSDGQARSFRVSGGRGHVLAITARRSPDRSSGS